MYDFNPKTENIGQHAFKTWNFSSDLTKLWNISPSNLEACKDRDFLPSLEDYFADAITQVESGTVAKDEDNLLKDSNFGEF